MLLTEVFFGNLIYSDEKSRTTLTFAVENDTVIFRQLQRLAREFQIIGKDEKLNLQDKRYLTVGLYTMGYLLLSVFFMSFSTVVFKNQVRQIVPDGVG